MKKLKLVNDIVPLCPTNAAVLAAKEKLESELYPVARISVLCDGKEVPADISFSIPTLRHDGPCSFCRNKKRDVADESCMFCLRHSINPPCEICKVKFNENCQFCRRKKVRRDWLKAFKPGRSPTGGDILLRRGTIVKSPKYIEATKGDKLGVITARYTKDGRNYSGHTESINVDWFGTTNIVIELGALKERR